MLYDGETKYPRRGIYNNCCAQHTILSFELDGVDQHGERWHCGMLSHSWIANRCVIPNDVVLLVRHRRAEGCQKSQSITSEIITAVSLGVEITTILTHLQLRELETARVDRS